MPSSPPPPLLPTTTAIYTPSPSSSTIHTRTHTQADQEDVPEATYQATFDTPDDGDFATVHLPWHSFVPVKRAQSDPQGEPLTVRPSSAAAAKRHCRPAWRRPWRCCCPRPGPWPLQSLTAPPPPHHSFTLSFTPRCVLRQGESISKLGLVLSRFEFNKAPNPRFQAGKFELQIAGGVQAFKAPRPQLVLLSSAGVERNALVGDDAGARARSCLLRMETGGGRRGWREDRQAPLFLARAPKNV